MTLAVRRTCAQVAALGMVAILLAFGSNALRNPGLPWMEDWTKKLTNLTSVGGIPVVDLPVVAGSYEDQNIMIIDARDREIYEQSHIPGAINLPIHAIDQFFDQFQSQFPPVMPVITYCDGAGCDQAANLAEFLKNNGYGQIHIFLAGLSEWTKAGLPTETGPGKRGYGQN
ncbi:MAG: rhodanese-like domain-containing protein [Deltaproteobacteria bacterium]|nr:rhodanese-like domain-containing protein [Deltaproteobacteria bacterium]